MVFSAAMARLATISVKAPQSIMKKWHLLDCISYLLKFVLQSVKRLFFRGSLMRAKKILGGSSVSAEENFFALTARFGWSTKNPCSKLSAL